MEETSTRDVEDSRIGQVARLRWTLRVFAAAVAAWTLGSMLAWSSMVGGFRPMYWFIDGLRWYGPVDQVVGIVWLACGVVALAGSFAPPSAVRVCAFVAGPFGALIVIAWAFLIWDPFVADLASGFAKLLRYTGWLSALVAGVTMTVLAIRMRERPVASPVAAAYPAGPAPATAGAAGGAGGAYGPGVVGSYVSMDMLPSIAPTVVVTALFGLFGLIPAAIHSNKANQYGLSGRKYWTAFAWTMVAQFVFWTAVVVLINVWIYNASDY